MKAVILAAGIGSRLAPISTDMPKCLICVAGKPILRYQIDEYLAAGLQPRDITVVLGYRANQVVEYLESSVPGVNIVINEDYASTNNMYSLLLALDNLAHQDETVFINNADCIYADNTIASLAKSPIPSEIATIFGLYNDESMKLVVGPEGRCVDIAKTIPQRDASGVSVDLYKFSPRTTQLLHSIIRRIIRTDGDRTSWTEVAFPQLFAQDEILPHYLVSNQWVEIDNLQDLTYADSLFSTFDVRKKDALVLDIDGTLALGHQSIPEAVSWVATAENRYDFYFISNNTSHPPRHYVDRLLSLGISTDERHVTTPLEPLSEYLRANTIASAYLVANTEVTTYLCRLHPDIEFDFNPATNQLVILTYDTEITYEKLRKSSELLHSQSVGYVATHSDVWCPTPAGPIPDIGAFSQLLEATTGRTPTRVFGKPEETLLSSVTARYPKDRIAIVGDRLYTDGLLANNSGIDFVCVLSGETTRYSLALAEVDRYPAAVIPHLGHIDGLPNNSQV